LERLLFIRKIKRIIYTILGILVILFVADRIYNNRAEFQSPAMEPEYYGIIDARFTNGEKLRDFKDLSQILETHYPFFKVNDRKNGIDWIKSKGRYKRIIKNTKNDAEFLVALNTILGELHDKNTFVLDGDLYRRYYLHYYPNRREILHYDRSLARYNYNGKFDLNPDVDFIFHNGPVLTTNVLDEQTAYMKIKAMSYYDIEEDLPKIKTFLQEVKDFQKLIIDIRGNEGEFDQYWERIVELLTGDTLRKEYISFFKENVISIYDPFKIENITTIKDLDEKVLGDLPQEIKSDFNFYKYNSIEINPKDSVGFRGKIYLLVDENVFSAAEKFAAFSKDTGFATLVGKPTGGGMTFEEIPMAYTPYGGYIIVYSRELVLNSDGTINMEAGTIPHILVDNVEFNEDFNRDKCIQAVIAD